MDYCKVRGLPLLLGCDANSHHKLWGSTDTNRRGEDLMDYLITTDLDILNTGTIPTFRNSVREEVIDITLCTGSFRDKVKLGQPWTSETQIGTRIIFIPKADKNGWTFAKDFRPIILTSFILKQWKDSWTDTSAIRSWRLNRYTAIGMLRVPVTQPKQP